MHFSPQKTKTFSQLQVLQLSLLFTERLCYSIGHAAHSKGFVIFGFITFTHSSGKSYSSADRDSSRIKGGAKAVVYTETPVFFRSGEEAISTSAQAQEASNPGNPRFDFQSFSENDTVRATGASTDTRVADYTYFIYQRMPRLGV